MAKRRENMRPLNTWQPRELVDQIDETRKPGESYTDFVRAAVVREIKRRGVKASMPDVPMGRPRSIYPDDWPKCPTCGEPCMDGKATCGNADCGP